MSVPSELPEIGSTAQRLRPNPRFDPVAAGIGPEEYFVWTRFDGATTLRDLILMTGFATPKAVDIVRRLRALGAVLLPNERPEAVAERLRPAAGAPARPAPAPPAAATAGLGPPRPRSDSDNAPTIQRRAIAPAAPPPPAAPAAAAPPPLPTDLSPEERAALDEDGELSRDERVRILLMHRDALAGDPLRILGIADATDGKATKRAYFALSKEFHPDRYYGRKTGSFGARLETIFEAIAAAFAALSSDRPRRGRAASPAAAAQSPGEHAADLFDRACQAEVAGDLAGALRLFASSLRLDPAARSFRRAARCAIAAGEARIAVEYAKKAANLEPNDPSTARVLAAAFKTAGKLADAEEVLVLALMIKSENDQLAHELQADLAEVRRLAAR